MLVNKHVKTARKPGTSAEPVIDLPRQHTQRTLRNLTEPEKQLFMSKLSHLWGIAGHYIPLHKHDKIQQFRIDGILHVISGKIIDIKESAKPLIVDFVDKKNHHNQSIEG